MSAFRRNAVHDAPVSQIVHGDERVLLLKERLAVSVPGGGSLSMLRKRPLGEARGAVVLLHGLGQNRYNWHLSKRSLSAYLVSRGYDVFNLELRGHGRSRELGSPPPRGFDEYVDLDVPAAAEALAHLGHERFFLMGHSLGGGVAYAVASRLEARLRGIVTLSGVFRWGSGALFIRAATPLLHIADRIHRAGGFGAGPTLRMDIAGRLVALNLAALQLGALPVPGGAWVRGEVETELLHEWLTRAFDRTSGSVLASMGRWASTGRFRDPSERRDYAEEWARCWVPVLVVGADRDRLADADRDVRPAYEVSRSPDRTWRLFGEAQDGLPFGHVDLIIGRQAPRIVWPVLADWLDEH